MKFDTILCHYAEVGLKLGNRRFFENWLMKNIKAALNRTIPDKKYTVRRLYGRIIIELDDNLTTSRKEITKALSSTFGIAYFAFARYVAQEIKGIREMALAALQDKEFETFKIKTRRPDQQFILTAQQVNEDVGAFILSKMDKTVQLKDPNVTCYIDIVQGAVYVYTEKTPGPGGLPTGANGKAVGLLSGGIDSPVASLLTMKRGAAVTFVHFHSVPMTTEESIEKVKQIITVLSRYQTRIHLYLVALTPIQKEILLKTKEKYRIILYRRFMFRIAEIIAHKEKARAIVTGESLGQVASQTLDNIAAIGEVSSMPILRPLIGLDKLEIINLAKRYGTYDISILPDQDCCSLFLPRSPATKAKTQFVEAEEENLAVDKLIQDAINSIHIIKILA